MGAGMAANLHRAGYLASAWNRTPDRGRLFAEDHGVSLATNPAALAEACDLIITCVSADQDLFEVADAFLPGLRQGAIVVAHGLIRHA